VTTALSLTQATRVPIAIILRDPDGETVPIFEPFEEYPLYQVVDALKMSNHADGSVSRIKSLLFTTASVEEGTSLIFIANIERYLDERNTNIIVLLIFLIIFILIALLLLRKVIARDVAREREIIENQERLRSETKEKEALLEFAGDASHELRTPLTVLKGYLELGAHRGVNLNDQATLEKMIKETTRMEETITGLLDVFAIETIPSMPSEMIDLSDFMESTIDSFHRTNPNRAFTQEIEGGVTIKGNRELLSRIIDNALINIQRHTRESDPVLIRVSRLDSTSPGKSASRSHLDDTAHKYVRIEIHDGGPGITDLATKDKARLFTRFDPSRSRQSGGSGLGLSIMKSATEKLGGTITLEPSHLGGLKVEITLPLT
jgi:signal transduction histidine kinase